jgi:hypothetical protein
MPRLPINGVTAASSLAPSRLSAGRADAGDFYAGGSGGQDWKAISSAASAGAEYSIRRTQEEQDKANKLELASLNANFNPTKDVFEAQDSSSIDGSEYLSASIEAWDASVQRAASGITNTAVRDAFIRGQVQTKASLLPNWAREQRRREVKYKTGLVTQGMNSLVNQAAVGEDLQRLKSAGEELILSSDLPSQEADKMKSVLADALHFQHFSGRISRIKTPEDADLIIAELNSPQWQSSLAPPDHTALRGEAGSIKSSLLKQAESARRATTQKIASDVSALITRADAETSLYNLLDSEEVASLKKLSSEGSPAQSLRASIMMAKQQALLEVQGLTVSEAQDSILRTTPSPEGSVGEHVDSLHGEGAYQRLQAAANADDRVLASDVIQGYKGGLTAAGLLDDLILDYTKRPGIVESTIMSYQRGALKHHIDNLKSSPLEYLAKRGRINLSDVFAEGGLKSRAEAIGRAATLAGLPESDIPPLTPGEVSRVTEVFSGDDPDSKWEVLNLFAGMPLDYRGGAFEQLDLGSSVYEHALGVAIDSGDSSIGLSIVRGKTAIDNNPDFFKADSTLLTYTLQPIITEALSGLSDGADSGAMQTVLDATLAYYADNFGKESLDSSDEEERLIASLNAVMGSKQGKAIQEFRGVQTWIPKDWTSDKLETRFEDSTVEDWEAASLNGGYPVYGNGQPVSLDELRENVTLRAVGPGEYQVLLDGGHLIGPDLKAFRISVDGLTKGAVK